MPRRGSRCRDPEPAAGVDALPRPGSTADAVGTGGRIVLAAAGPEGEEEEERDPEGRPLWPQDRFNISNHRTAREALAKVDPSNPALGQLTRPDWSHAKTGCRPRKTFKTSKRRWRRLRQSRKDYPQAIWTCRRNSSHPMSEELLTGRHGTYSRPPENRSEYTHSRAGDEVRTVSASEFQEIQNILLQGATPVSKPGYGGSWYKRPDGSEFGVRVSAQSGVTIDINDPFLPPGFTVHQK